MNKPNRPNRPLIAGQIDRSGDLVGKHIRLLSVSRTRPRLLYLATCELCKSTWTGHADDDQTCHSKRCASNKGGQEDISHLSWREQHRIEQEREQAAALSKVEAEFKRLSNETRAMERESVMVWKDHEFIHTPETRNQALTPEFPTLEANNNYSRLEAEAFVRETPGYFACEENMSALVRYLEQQATTHRVSRGDLDRAYRRLQPLGLLRDRPKAEEPELPPEPVPGTIEGYSIATKKKYVRRYTPQEVAKMTAAEYRKAVVDYDDEQRRSVPEPQPATNPDEVLWGFGKDGAPLALTRRQIELLPADEYRRFLSSAGENEGLTREDLILRRKNW